MEHTPPSARAPGASEMHKYAIGKSAAPATAQHPPAISRLRPVVICGLSLRLTGVDGAGEECHWADKAVAFSGAILLIHNCCAETDTVSKNAMDKAINFFIP